MSLEENDKTDGEEPTKAATSSHTTNTLGKEVSAKRANIKEIKANIKHNISTLTKKPPEHADKQHQGGEPARFLGEGVCYRAKLIGILEVGDARGDRMCQEALADLKMAIRAAGEHKQRITIHIAIDGLRLRDDKTGDCLYHHPVHKISFIAQDMTDSRAFGYIFGSPDTGHRFFGIKTDKAASQVVISMRDLFQVVFELKKKEIEMAKQHIEQHQIKYNMGIVPEPIPKISLNEPGFGKMRTILEDGGSWASGGGGSGGGGSAGAASSSKSSDSGVATSSKTSTSKDGAGQETAIADLLDLELELSSIQQGLSQMERITPSDPFGDSFAPPASAAPAATKLLPPPPKGGSSSSGAAASHKKGGGGGLPSVAAPAGAVAAQEQSLFNDEQTGGGGGEDKVDGATTPTKIRQFASELLSSCDLSSARDQFDVFTELDPLGTGRSKPYIDKKDFFQELKNPPKKVLKDLVGELPKETPPLFQASFDCDKSNDTIFPVTTDSESSFPVVTDPFGDDPFDKTDPFDESSMSKVFFPNLQTSKDPFDTCFADFTAFGRSPNNENNLNSLDEVVGSSSKHRKSPRFDEGSDSSIHGGPLRVSLPPEKQLSTSPRTRNKYGRTSSSLVKLPSPKQKSRSRSSRQTTVDSSFDRSSPLDSGMTLKNGAVISPSPPPQGLLDSNSAPEPPPRPPNTTTPPTPIIKPPPLPPKRQGAMTPLKQPFRPLQLDYDYIENYETLGSSSNSNQQNSNDVQSPPIPVPARRPRYGGSGGAESSPQRPLKHNQTEGAGGGTEPEYYLTPFPLLPPPLKKTGTSPKPQDSSTSRSPSVLDSNTSAVPKESAKQSSTSSLDITLSQLSKTGFSDLASTLGMSPTSLSRMTLQELTKCLQSLNESETKSEDKSSARNSIFKSEQYSALRESIEEDAAPFKAEFDSHFNSDSTSKENNTAANASGANEESLFDKYAVFRELLEQEKVDNQVEEVVDSNEAVDNRVEEVEKPRVGTAPLAKGEEIDDDLPETDEVSVQLPVVSNSVSEDRYAALREITFEDDFIQEEEEEEVKVSEMKEGGDDEEEEEGRRSRQHSESTESPTATMKEPQSIMETTIIEEDMSALEADDDDNVPEEVMGEMEMSLPTVAESSESIDKEPESPICQRGEPVVPRLKEDLVDDEDAEEEDEEDESGGGRKGLAITNLIEGWAKFDNNEKTSEGNVSPWSIDSKDINKETFWKERPDRVERSRDERSREIHTKGRKAYKMPDDDWGGEGEEDGEESEDGWRWGEDGGTWRENGWSDGGESFYDDMPPPPQYSRRGRRRRVSPRRKTSRDPSPWEDEERWDDSRRVEEYRPKHRGSSLEEDRRKRRLSPWAGGEPDRRSSRESLAWEEEEQQRYRRPYRDRRHRRYEDSYGRSSREYREQPRRNYQGYYRDRSHESPWEDSEQGEEDSPRPRKQAPWSGGSGGRQGGPPPQDSEEEMYRYRDPRKSGGGNTLKGRGNRGGKKRGQTSPFEDDFSAHTFQFPPSDSKSPGSDVSEQFPPSNKHSPCTGSKPHLSPDYYLGKKEFDNSGESGFPGGKLEAKTKNSRQSPFEDDFTPPETRRYSGRSVSSDASDKSGRKDDVRCNDDVFIPEYRHRCERFMSEISAKGRRGRSSNLNNGDVGDRRHDGENMLRRHDSDRRSNEGRQDSDRRLQDSENKVSRRQDSENMSNRRQDSENMGSRRQDSENMMSRRQDSENMSSRRQDSEGTMSRRPESGGSMSRRQDSGGTMSRRLDNENMTSRRQDSDSMMSRRQDSESRRKDSELRRLDNDPRSEGILSRRHDSETMSPLAIESRRLEKEKHSGSFGDVDSPPAGDARQQRRDHLKSGGGESPSDAPPLHQPVRHLGGGRRQAGDLKMRVSSLRRTDSSSSLRKSESVNIFARNSDPFDDDDFFAAAGGDPCRRPLCPGWGQGLVVVRGAGRRGEQEGERMTPSSGPKRSMRSTSTRRRGSSTRRASSAVPLLVNGTFIHVIPPLHFSPTTQRSICDHKSIGGDLKSALGLNYVGAIAHHPY
ncbi:protein disabled [Nilaparvata lugens]|uniref:protein disabled n=1 Tax=Nilaparvata lugens TaxID=108931 RepID=UPI00193CD02B|nr:protein disabled [Nilaparvata lugens]